MLRVWPKKIDDAEISMSARFAIGLGFDLNIVPTPNGLRCAMRYEYPTGWDL